MKKYIFYTSEGFTENQNGENTENCQILGWQRGKDEKDAFKKFQKNFNNINFKSICCQELASEKVFYF